MCLPMLFTWEDRVLQLENCGQSIYTVACCRRIHTSASLAHKSTQSKMVRTNGAAIVRQCVVSAVVISQLTGNTGNCHVAAVE